jgi:hypothetical protein
MIRRNTQRIAERASHRDRSCEQRAGAAQVERNARAAKLVHLTGSGEQITSVAGQMTALEQHRLRPEREQCGQRGPHRGRIGNRRTGQ